MNAIKQLRYGLAALLLGTATACWATSAQLDESKPNLIYVSPTDSKMEAAKRDARASLPTFFAHLASPAADESNFGLKFNLTPDGDAEFIWAGELQIDNDGKITGVLDDIPLNPHFKQGQRVVIDQARIIDWGYRKGRIYQGNYTTRVLLDQMPAEEAAEIRAALGW